MRTAIITCIAIALIRCDGFVGEVSIKPTTQSTVAAPQPTRVSRQVDPREVTVRLEGPEDELGVNPEADYRFNVSLTNNAAVTIKSIKGVVSVRSANGSDLLVNHPFTVAEELPPAATRRVVVDIPVADNIARKSQIQLNLTAAEAK